MKKELENDINYPKNSIRVIMNWIVFRQKDLNRTIRILFIYVGLYIFIWL